MHAENTKKRFCYRVVVTEYGTAAVIFQLNPFAVKRILLPTRHQDGLKDALAAADAEMESDHENAGIVCRNIADYFTGKRVDVPWEWLSFESLTDLECKTLTVAASIPYGETRSYKEIASKIDRPNAYRFVGATMAKNPFPVFIPCHRVIRSDNTLGDFGGGVELKRRMLELEGNGIASTETP